MALAAAAGWDRTKVSKIEHGTRSPSSEDIRTWCRVCRAEDQAADLEQAIAARVTRQKVLREGDHTFAFVLEESALWARLARRGAMREQVAHLLEVMAWPRISLGIIPAAAERSLWPVEGFWMFDDERVAIETVSAWITVTRSAEIALYAAAFDELAALAAYGDPARGIITALLQRLG